MSGWGILGWLIGSLVPPLAVAVVAEMPKQITAWRRRAPRLDVLKEVIRTDAQMLNECLKLSIEHFKAASKMRQR